MSTVVQALHKGAADVLVATDIEPVEPKAGEVRIRHQAIGVNFVDIYFRRGLYPLPAWPATLGVEAAGVIDAVGPGVATFMPGDRVAWAGGPPGGYAVFRNLPAERVLALPEKVTVECAGGSLLRAMTAEMVLGQVGRVQPGQTVLIHASAGGLGRILVRYAKALGARVVGTVGSDQKAALSGSDGADLVLVGRDADFVSAVRRFTDGVGADLVIDGIGGGTLTKSLDAARLHGMVVSLGQAGGPIPAMDIAELGPPRSIALARPSILGLCAVLPLYRETASKALALLAGGGCGEPSVRYPLANAAEAHRALEAGRTAGSIILIP